MAEYRYILEKGSKKHLCPQCGKRRFVRYIDTETKQYLPVQYGRCDSESKCKHHLNPYKDGYAKGAAVEHIPLKRTKPAPAVKYYIPEAILNRTLSNYETNTFIQNLTTLCPVKDIEKVISLYRLGTLAKGCRAGAVTFPFIDIAGNIRTIQAKQFDERNHTTSTDFVHSILTRYYTEKGEALPGWLQDYTKNEKFVSCFFGEHLLKEFPLNPVALVEAPKTAIIGSLYYGLPETPGGLLWLAVYNKSSLTPKKCEVLKGRKVVLYPDLNAYNEWSEKIEIISGGLPGTRFVVSDILEKYATPADITAGLDLADYLTRFDYKLFRKEQPEPMPAHTSEPPQEPEPIPAPIVKSEKSEKSEVVNKPFETQKNKLTFNEEPVTLWDIEELENFFSGIQIPTQPVKLNRYSTIIDTSKFIAGHLTTVKRNNGNKTFLPYLNRLNVLKEYLTENLN